MVEQNVEGLPECGTEEVTCKHHWLIEPPNGRTSMGVCKICGATREFDNQLPSRNATQVRTQAQSNDQEVLTTS